jgi:hypothetical protein
MNKIVWGALGALALAGGAFPVNAQQVENAQMPRIGLYAKHDDRDAPQ